MRSYVLVIIIIMFIPKSGGKSPCLASENKRWKISQRKCVDCQLCPAGKARNFTEPYVGRTVQFGDTQCLPCRKCPEGYYAGDTGCLPCRMFCDTDYFREFNEYCEGSHDARCGSCLFGYEDSYRDIKQPCTKRHEYEADRDNIHVDRTDLNIRDRSNGSRTENGSVVHNVETLNTTESRIIIIVIIISTIIIIIIPVYLVLRQKKYFRRKQKSVNTKHSGRYDDLQTDCGGSNSCPLGEVRGELTGATPLLRPELSTGPDTQPIAMITHGLTSNQPFQCVQNLALPCGCRVDPNCQCFKSDLLSIEIKKSDNVIMEVSTSICHSPEKLFDALKLDYSIIYPIEEDRRLDPAGTTFQDKMLRILNRWVEVNPSPVTLHTLMQALCESNFHRINHKLKQNYSVDTFENDDGRMA